jgi:hypothetical protein
VFPVCPGVQTVRVTAFPVPAVSWLTVAPSVPFNLTATGQFNNNTVQLRIDASALAFSSFSVRVAFFIDSFTVPDFFSNITVQLTVFSVPNSPVGLSFTALNTSYERIQWSNGGDGLPLPGKPVTAYELALQPAGQGFSVVYTGLALNVLIPVSYQTVYNVQLRAQNSAGWSVAAVSSFTSAGSPPPAQVLTLGAMTPNTVQVQTCDTICLCVLDYDCLRVSLFSLA